MKTSNQVRKKLNLLGVYKNSKIAAGRQSYWNIPGAYAQASKLDRYEDIDAKSDSDLEDLTEGMAEVKLLKETKSRIRAPWSKALIVKVFGRTVDYNYPNFKINALWKLVARMDCVDLSKDFCSIKFSDDADYDKVLHGGLWFIREHFLAIRPWEPYFKASEANFNVIAMWVRFP